MYGTPQIKLPTKSSLQHTLGLQTRARNLNKNYWVPTEDVKLLRRNLRACLQEVTRSFRLFKLARSALQIMKYFSHRHKLQRFEAGLNGAACFKIFQVKLNPILASFKCQMCLLSSVLSLLFGSLKEDLWFESHVDIRQPWLFIFLSISVCLSIYLTVCLSVYLCICLSLIYLK